MNSTKIFHLSSSKKEWQDSASISTLATMMSSKLTVIRKMTCTLCSLSTASIESKSQTYISSLERYLSWRQRWTINISHLCKSYVNGLHQLSISQSKVVRLMFCLLRVLIKLSSTCRWRELMLESTFSEPKAFWPRLSTENSLWE